MQETTSLYHTLQNVVALVILIGAAGWFFFQSLKRTEDASLLVFKWILTAVLVVYMVSQVAPVVQHGGTGAIAGVLTTTVCGLALAIIWRRSIAGFVAKPFSNLYDGGDQEIEPQAYYSVAESKRKRGLYTEAVAEIRRQLAQFPADVRGHMLLAEIQAENMNDLPGAEITILRFCNQPEHSPRNVVFALNTLADWQLKYTQDRDAARQTLEKVVKMFPDTEVAHLAEQRIAHLASTEYMLQPHARTRVSVPQGVKYVGLMESSAQLAPAEESVESRVDALVKILTAHPLDTDAREKLAILYADEYQRLDLAADQLEQLIQVPTQTPKKIARWLNLLAQLQIKSGRDYETVKATLRQIIERYPDHPAAQLAQNRIDTLKLELKGRTSGAETVKLGEYEQYIGLKTGRPGTA